MVGQGLARMPGKAAMGAVMASNMLRSGGGGRGGGGRQGGGDEHPALADLPSRFLGGAGWRGLVASSAAALGPAGGSSGAAAPPLGPGAAAGAGAVERAGHPPGRRRAGRPVAASGGRVMAKDKVTSSADAQTQAPPTRPGGPSTWSFRPDGDDNG